MFLFPLPLFDLNSCSEGSIKISISQSEKAFLNKRNLLVSTVEFGLREGFIKLYLYVKAKMLL